MKRKVIVLSAFIIGFLCAFGYKQIQINKLVISNKADLQRAQQLFDIDQQMITVDVNAYQALFHCYDKPKTCDIYNPGGKADRFESESIKLTKEKQNIITQYPYLIPSKYLPVWKAQ